MKKFAILLPHSPTRYDGLNENDYLEIIKDYVGWVEARSAEGVYVDGVKLKADGRGVDRTKGGVEIHESPFAEATEILGGIMIIKARDYAHALELTADHPHLKHNDRLEIREIDEID